MTWRPCRQLGLLLSLILVGAAQLARADDTRPNVVLILCDDMGFSDLGCFGSEIETPHLDQLAADGLRFTDFHNNAKCSETRASLLTGLWHQQSQNLKQRGYVTLADVLRASGYTTLMSGKWHLAHHPMDHGFDRYFGFLNGAINFFTGRNFSTGENFMRLDRGVFEAPAGFYSTDAFTNYATEFVDQAVKLDRPFFLYVAHNAPHFPLHALPEDIHKYRGKYAEGWDVIRQRRFARLSELGLIDDSWTLADRDANVEPWDELGEREKAFLERLMEVYAAMVDRLDQNVGRLVDHLRKIDQLDNTLILFMSDNGACPYQRLQRGILTPGPEESGIAYDARWANLCNTPLRLYKQYAHAGGTQTPMIAHWPNRIKARGSLVRFPAHVVDIMPTLVEVADADYPSSTGDVSIMPMEGTSLLSVLAGDTESTQRIRPMFWEFRGNHAVRDGDWKLVAERSKSWELYHVVNDRSEVLNLVTEHPDRVARMSSAYDDWAARVGARTHAACVATKPSTQSQRFDLPNLLKD